MAMLIDVRSLTDGQPCAILGVGHTVLPETCRYDNQRFILNPDQAAGALSLLGRHRLFHELETKFGRGQSETELAKLADEKFVAATGIQSRLLFPGTPAELGAMAAEQALEQAGVAASELDAILVGTNTGSGYPSTADRVKDLIGARADAVCFDLQEACSVGAIAVQQGWEKIRSRMYRKVLVVAAEKATTLASPDDYKAANLFGDAAFAYVLGADTIDDFVFFEAGSDPSNGQSEYITKTPTGFQQSGPAVHKYVGKAVPELLARTFERLKLDPATVHHFFPHQPSAKTLDFMVDNIRRRWPTFNPVIHRNVEEMGNTSGACTGWMISRAKAAGQLQPGQFGVVATFGSGMSWGLYGFIVR